ncbi:N-acetylmuramoyl-L-alanine amidase [bacterium]|nr:N-acetylmuramoyl-L-alanine amidase [bacterium]
MNKTLILGLFLSHFAAHAAVAPDRLPSELRPVLGDARQLHRTASVNWPFASADNRRIPPKPSPAIPSIAKATALETPQPLVEIPELEPDRIRVVIDAGHGGHDMGAQGGFHLKEKEICLRIARMVHARLDRLARLGDLPLEIRLSRTEDAFIPLRERARIANSWGADFFVSIHVNSSPAIRARGFEVYFLSNEASDAEASRLARKENQEPAAPLSAGILSILSDLQTNAHILESSRFAEVVHAALAERVRANGRGVRQAPFSVLAGTQMPALLVEVGYLTNPEEAQLLPKTTHQTKLASGIAEGILNAALRLHRRPDPPTPKTPATASLK